MGPFETVWLLSTASTKQNIFFKLSSHSFTERTDKACTSKSKSNGFQKFLIHTATLLIPSLREQELWKEVTIISNDFYIVLLMSTWN